MLSTPSGVEIASLVVEIVSLVSSIGVAVGIFWLQNRLEKTSNDKNEKIHETIAKEMVEERARVFIEKNINEIEYLTLAQVAASKQLSRKISSDGSGKYIHKRKLYSFFYRCALDLQKEVLRQSGLVDYNLEKYEIEKLVDCMINLFLKDASELGILDFNFLYDGGKYFHRGINRYGNEDIIDQGKLEGEIWDHLIDFMNYQRAGNKEEMFNNLVNSPLSPILKPMYKRPKIFEEFAELNKTPPLDWYWQNRASSAEEKVCCFVVMEMIMQGALLISGEKYGKRERLFDFPQALTKTYEDLYYSIVLTLYCIYYDQVDNFLVEVKKKEDKSRV